MQRLEVSGAVRPIWWVVRRQRVKVDAGPLGELGSSDRCIVQVHYQRYDNRVIRAGSKFTLIWRL